jgi:aldose 1-epimerase
MTNLSNFVTEETITFGNQSATITNLGGALREYKVGGKDVIHPFQPSDFPMHCAGLPLLPFPNRLEDGLYEYAGVTYQMPINEVARNNAIHGFGDAYQWTFLEKVETGICSYIEVVLHLPPRKYYPFDLIIKITYLLSELGLAVTTEVKNMSNSVAPFGIGFHPWLSLHGTNLDDATLFFSAKTHIKVDERLLPIGKEPIEDTQFCFRTPRKLKGVAFDDAFIDIERSEKYIGTENYLATVELVTSDSTKTTLWFDESLPCLQICSADWGGDTRFALAVEPMSCYANSFKTGEYLQNIEPKSTFISNWGLQLS